MTNIFTSLPKRGDVVVGEIATTTVKFITLETFSLADLNTAVYETIGAVVRRKGKKVLIAYKENASKVWCNRAYWTLTGYTLDGTARTGKISARFASNSWASNIDLTVSYTATTLAELASALNSAFAGSTDYAGQDWHASVVGSAIELQCNNVDYRQLGYNTASDGFTLSSGLPDITALSSMRRKNGYVGGEGAISNWDRAIAYYTNDNGSASYLGGRTSVQTSVKQSYPINLPTWLGTSTQNPGDFCSALRAVYGEGETGWKKFMESCLPVCPTNAGNMAQDFGLAITKQMKEKLVASDTLSAVSCFPAAEYCYGKSTTCIPAGNWYLPTVRELHDIMDGIKYNTTASRTADVLNEALYKLGGSAISNSSSVWSCCRYSSYLAWNSYGSYGFFHGYGVYNGGLAVPVSLFTLP